MIVPARHADRVAMRDRRSGCRCPAREAAAMVLQTGTAAAGYSRMTAAVPGPLILAEDGQSPGPARAELAFHRTRDATCRVPRAGRFSGWTMHTPAADSNAARRASRMARQTARMTSSHPDERDRAGGVGSGTRPRVTIVMRARCGDDGRIVSRSGDRKSTRLNSSHPSKSRMPSSA